MHAKHTLPSRSPFWQAPLQAPRAAAPGSAARVVETTSQGYTLTVSVNGSGKTGTLALECPSGKRLGTSARFDIHRGHFTAIRLAQQHRQFRFTGDFDQREHVRGHGSVRAGACADGVASSFSEGALGTARCFAARRLARRVD